MKRVLLTLAVFLFFSEGGVLLAQEAEPVTAQETSPAGLNPEDAHITFLAASVDVDSTPDNKAEDFLPARLDMEVPVGSIIRTGKNALCEVTMPDGSLLRIASGSVFKVETVAVSRETGSRVQRFQLIFGKLKAKAQKLASADSSFEVVSGTALAGVRGTVFGVSFDGNRSQVLVFEGSVNLQSVTAESEPVVLGTRRMGTLGAEGVPRQVRRIPKAVIARWDREFGVLGSTAAASGPEREEAKEEEAAEEARGTKSALSAFLTLDAHVGTVTMDGNAYARWIFAPALKFGKVGVGLYLPAVFTPENGLFGFDDWQNRGEWDFTDFGDGLHDLLLKLSYLSYGEPGDPVYGKLGGIDDFALGHGFIVDGYSNMIAFPEGRKAGLQLNLDGKIAGFESVVGDFSRFELFGGRIYARPFGSGLPLALGVTAVHDRAKPGAGIWPLIGGTTSEDELPRVLVFGVDAEAPLVNLDRFSMKFYADAAKLAYVYPEVPSTLAAYGVKAGAPDFVKGIGTGFGAMGNIAKRFTYRAEYRYIHNYYEPGIIDKLWDNRRLTYPRDLQRLIIEQNTAGYDDTNTAGFLLKGGVRLLEKLEFGLGYESYKRSTGAGAEPVKKGGVYVDLGEGLLPKVSGRASYTRTDDLESVFEEPFDENTVFGATVSYALAPRIALSASYNRSFVLDEDTGVSEHVDSFGLSTVIRFF